MRVLVKGLIAIIIIAMSISIYQMLIIRNTYVHEEQVHTLMSGYAPVETSKAKESAENEINNEDASTMIKNVSLINAKRDINDDITAWIRIPNTRIDYPVAYYTDNDYYLNHDILKNNAASGSLFVDNRNNKEFIDFNTIIYGHNMKNGTMFGDLSNFSNMGYFSNNTSGLIFLPDKTYYLEIFAFLQIKQDNRIIYGSISGENFTEFTEYVKQNALHYRDIQLSEYDRIVTLSTCADDGVDSRDVVLARLNAA